MTETPKRAGGNETLHGWQLLRPTLICLFFPPVPSERPLRVTGHSCSGAVFFFSSLIFFFFTHRWHGCLKSVQECLEWLYRDESKPKICSFLSSLCSTPFTGWTTRLSQSYRHMSASLAFFFSSPLCACVCVRTSPTPPLLLPPPMDSCKSGRGT